MPVLYRGEELVPAPLINYSKTPVRSDDGTILYFDHTFTLNGTIVNIGTELSSPDAEGHDFADMNGVLSEMRRIRNLFSIDGGRLEITAPPAGGPHSIDIYPIIESISFDEASQWTNRCNYTIILKANKIEGNSEVFEGLASTSENWSITENEDGTYNISHELEAVGLKNFGPSGANNPLNIAKQWCQDRSYSIDSDGSLSANDEDTIDFTNLIGPLASDSANFWNYAAVETVNTSSNSWQLTENFIYNPSGSIREELNATVSFDQENPRKATINLNGSIFGFADKASNISLRNTNAKNYYNSIAGNLYTRALNYAPGGFTVNATPDTRQITYEDTAGTVRYSYTYSCASGNMISGAIDESINISDIGHLDVFAQIQIPGRANGPLIQNMETVTSPERTVSITATLAQDTSALTPASLLSMYNSKPNVEAFIDACKPNAGYYYMKQNSEDWNPVKRQYSRIVSWVLDTEGQSITGLPSGHNHTE